VRLDALRRIFARLVKDGDWSPYNNNNNVSTTETQRSESSSERRNNSSNNSTSTGGDGSSSSAAAAAGVVRKWRSFLDVSFGEAVERLSRRIACDGDDETATALVIGSSSNNNASRVRTSVRTFWGFIAGCPLVIRSKSSSTNTYRLVSTQLLLKWLDAACAAPASAWSDAALQRTVRDEFVVPFRDVQYYVMAAVASLASSSAAVAVRSNRHGRTTGTSTKKNQERRRREHLARARQVSERLLEILCMIPIVRTQADLDGDSSSYLFPPPPPSPLSSNDDDDDDDSSSSDNNDDDDDDSDADSDSDSDGDDDDDNNGERPAKRAKRDDDKKKKNKKRKFNFQLARYHRKAWSKAWLAVLKLTLPVASLKKALHFLPQHVLPNVPNPLLFADFFMSAYGGYGGGGNRSDNNNDATAATNADNADTASNYGNARRGSSIVVPILALDGLFLLVTQHGLEYPDFYKQLYRLVTPSMLYYKHRARFFDLLERCLCKNPMLPAHVVAAFAKRLLRSAVSAPPASILFALGIVSNLLKQHPEVSCLVHRRSDDGKFRDGFDEATDDPERANALQSSLYELNVLERHYYGSTIGTLAQSIGREDEDRQPMHNLQESFIGHTYKSFFEQERKRRPKRGQPGSKTPLTFVKPTTLFTPDDVFAGILKTGSAQDAQALEDNVE